jgi:hypothetical protein
VATWARGVVVVSVLYPHTIHGSPGARGQRLPAAFRWQPGVTAHFHSSASTPPSSPPTQHATSRHRHDLPLSLSIDKCGVPECFVSCSYHHASMPLLRPRPHQQSKQRSQFSPSKDLSFRHTTRQFIRQQREGKSLSLLISAICMEGIAESLHRHITDAHFPALQDRLILCGTKALWNERRRRVQSETIGSGDENNKTPCLPPHAQLL